MEILYQRGKASASEVRESMPHTPTYSTVRAVLLHQLAHIQRCDSATQLLARLTLALYW